MPNPEKITIDLTRQEALVFFEFLTRCDEEEKFVFIDQAEQRVLWKLQCVLEKNLVEVFDPNYGELLKKAWDTIRDSD